MAVGTQEKRSSATSLLVPSLVPGVWPHSSIGSDDRRAATWAYTGIFGIPPDYPVDVEELDSMRMSTPTTLLMPTNPLEHTDKMYRYVDAMIKQLKELTEAVHSDLSLGKMLHRTYTAVPNVKDLEDGQVCLVSTTPPKIAVRVADAIKTVDLS